MNKAPREKRDLISFDARGRTGPQGFSDPDLIPSFGKLPPESVIFISGSTNHEQRLPIIATSSYLNYLVPVYFYNMHISHVDLQTRLSWYKYQRLATLEEGLPLNYRAPSYPMYMYRYRR